MSRDLLEKAALTGAVLLAVLAVFAFGYLQHSGYLQPDPLINCPAERLGAIELVKSYPYIDVPYIGAEERQCQLNEVVGQYRATR